MSNIEYRLVIKFFTWKGLNATKISKELDSVSTKMMLRPTAPSPSQLLDLKTQDMASKIHLKRTVHPPLQLMKIFKPWNAPKWVIGKSVRRLAHRLGIPTITVYEIMSNQFLDMKEVSTRWVRKLFTPIQRANRVDCCQELLQENQVNPDNCFDRIVTGDETCLYYYDLLGEQEAR